jgi:predicted TPR repeat methyltransferase
VNLQQEKNKWDAQYRTGQWTHLDDQREFARYALLAAYIQRRGKAIYLLDIGCGEGIILKYLKPELISQYDGIDIAQAALDRIQNRRSQDRYICSGIQDFSPDARWDVILFNEVLYYTDDPVEQIAKFESALTPQGYFLISMHRKSSPLAWNNRCIRAVRRYFSSASYKVDDSIELATPECAWQVFVARPPAVSQP